jgi:hypothetical protein
MIWVLVSMILLENNHMQVQPVIVRPDCYLDGRSQDCLRCGKRDSGECLSTMARCTSPYPGHIKGCPNYGLKDDCPPNMPVFDEIFDMSQPVYCIYSKFDMASHAAEMKRRHPGWSARQCRCCLYWQGGAKKTHKEYAASVYGSLYKPGFHMTDSPEAMGVDVTETLKHSGISLEWPCVEHTYKISFAGCIKPDILDSMSVRGRQIALNGNDGFIIIEQPVIFF